MTDNIDDETKQDLLNACIELTSEEEPPRKLRINWEKVRVHFDVEHLHFKKDGSLDMRYSSSRKYAPGNDPERDVIWTILLSLRYKLHETLGKDGKQSEYESVKEDYEELCKEFERTAITAHSDDLRSDRPLHYTRNGLDMRYTSSKSIPNWGRDKAIESIPVMKITDASEPDSDEAGGGIGAKRPGAGSNASTNKPEIPFTTEDFAKYDKLCDKYIRLGGKALTINVNSTCYGDVFTDKTSGSSRCVNGDVSTEKTKTSSRCVICDKTCGTVGGNYEYHLRTFHPMLYNCITVNRHRHLPHIQTKMMEVPSGVDYNHVFYSIPCRCNWCLKHA
jgi:hypothetical protein